MLEIILKINRNLNNILIDTVRKGLVGKKVEIFNYK